ncbi:MAG: hypothetical protein CVT77_06320 [Alphaproteobacteria bacterium HGW-Alphaproteobacteria-16]|nr:MAG: hypothetical protein CVT77_06320 [Alphaproteobacteria bacterium HGW-Alphaproteobacteria-16]
MDHQPTDPPEVPNGIEFAPWNTVVESDDLHMVRLRYGEGPSKVDFPSDGFALELPGDEVGRTSRLEATFLSREKRAAVVFYFENVSAFRVLDEHGLLDIWNASMHLPRPANSTFKVRGHKWQEESFLSWEMFDCKFSLMIATNWDCLEVVTADEPRVELKPAIVTEYRVESER